MRYLCGPSFQPITCKATKPYRHLRRHPHAVLPLPQTLDIRLPRPPAIGIPTRPREGCPLRLVLEESHRRDGVLGVDGEAVVNPAECQRLLHTKGILWVGDGHRNDPEDLAVTAALRGWRPGRDARG